MADLILNITLEQDFELPPLPAPEFLLYFTAIGASSSTIGLSWIDQGLLADNYVIEWATNPAFTGANTATIPSLPASGSIYTITGLTAATYYYVRIKATNVSGSSAWVTDGDSTL